MNTKPRSSWNFGLFKRTVGVVLPCLAFVSMPCALLRAQVPANPLVELSFSEGTGSTATNTGTLGGYANLQLTDSINDPDLTAGNEDPGGYPLFSTNVPVGPYAPANLYSANNGTVSGNSVDGSGQGGWQVNLTNTPYQGGLTYASGYTATSSGGLGTNFPGFTLCLWVNTVDLNANGKQNEIVYALDGPDGGPQNGFNLVHNSGGNVQCSINESAGDAPISVGTLTADANAGSNNWTFVAVTYDYTLSSNNLSYYFGKGNQLAYLDSASTYIGGLAAGQGLPPYITNTGILTLGNYGPVDDQFELLGGNSSRIFKGYVSEVKVYTNVLTLDQIQQAQLNGAVSPTAPSFLAGGQPFNETVPSGLAASFKAVASGSGQLSYQWKTNGVNVAGATSSAFSIPNVQLGMNGWQVSVGVTNSVSPGILSSNATLTVVPSNPLLVSMSFDEGYFQSPKYKTNAPNGTLTTNAGALGGNGLTFNNGHVILSGLSPNFSGYVPVGPFAPNSVANVSSLFNGTYYDNVPCGCSSQQFSSQGDRGVDLLTNGLSSSGLLPTMTGLTICGWLNSSDCCFRGTSGTQNVIVDALNSTDTVGFRLVHDPSWALELEVNQRNSGTDAQSSYSVGGSGGIPVDINMSTNNWVFFAVTYDGTLTANNVNYYFGSPYNQVALDSSSPLTYNQGSLTSAGPVTIGNLNQVDGTTGRAINGSTAAYFHGFMDEIKIYSSVLTLAQIQAVQTGTEVPIILFASQQGGNVVLTWGATTTEHLQSRTNLTTGSWANVSIAPVVSGNIYTVTLPETNSQTFFRLSP